MARLFGREYTRSELLRLVGDMSQVAGIRRAELVEGNERGAGLLEVSNASGLNFSVLPGAPWTSPAPSTRAARCASAAPPATSDRRSSSRRATAGCAASTAAC